MIPAVFFLAPLAAAPESASTGPETVSALLESAGKWVVAVRVERKQDLPASPFQPRRVSPEARDAFRRPDGFVSGILVDADGHVLTSLYNLGGEIVGIAVTLPSGESFPARLLGKSPQDDVALLAIDHGDRQLMVDPPRWSSGGEDTAIRAGQFVFVLGRSPDPGALTATRGVVSAGGRNAGRALQTDAELNYGNTGGPVIDLSGRIVAMAGFVGHTQPQWGINSGVGFGTKASVILDILPRLKAGETISAFNQGFLGVQCAPAEPQQTGTRVVGVVDGSAAQKAGIREGDVILEIDAKPIYDFDHLRRSVFARKEGDKLRLKVKRQEDTFEVEAVLGPRPPP